MIGIFAEIEEENDYGKDEMKSYAESLTAYMEKELNIRSHDVITDDNRLIVILDVGTDLKDYITSAYENWTDFAGGLGTSYQVVDMEREKSPFVIDPESEVCL